MLALASSIRETADDSHLNPRWLLNNTLIQACNGSADDPETAKDVKMEPFHDSCSAGFGGMPCSQAVPSWRTINSTTGGSVEKWKYVPLRLHRKNSQCHTTVFSRNENETKQYMLGCDVDLGTLTNGNGIRKPFGTTGCLQSQQLQEHFLIGNAPPFSLADENTAQIVSHGTEQGETSRVGSARALRSSGKASLAPSAPGSQRSRSHDLSEEDSEDEEGEGSRKDKGKGKDSDADFSYPCPYARGDRATYERCVFRSFPTLRKLRIHLHNTHFKLFKSDTCEHRAGTRAELARHLKTKGHLDNPQRCPADNGLPSLKHAEALFEQVKMKSSSTQTWDDIFRMLHPSWSYPLPKERYVQYSAFVDCFPYTPGEFDTSGEQGRDTPMSEAPLSESTPGTPALQQPGNKMIQENVFLRGEVMRLSRETEHMSHEIARLNNEVAFLLKYYAFYQHLEKNDPNIVHAFFEQEERGLSEQFFT